MATIKGSERNIICPRCGQKLKRCRCRPKLKRWQLFSAISVLILILALGVNSGINLYQERADKILKTKIDHFSDVLDKYVHGRGNKDVWWLKKTQASNIPQRIESINKKEARIHEILNQYKSVSPLAGEISKNFQVFWITSYINGLSQKLFIPGHPPPQNPDIEVCFVPQDQNQGHPSSLYYKSEWKALLIHGFEFPEILYPAILFHELGHALYHIVRQAPSSVAPANSDSYISEEIIMHELENDIIDNATEGKYNDYIDNYLNNFSGKADYKDVILSIGLRNLRELDEITGSTKYGPKVANILGGQYLLTIGLRYIDNRNPNNKMQRKISLYRWATNLK